MHNKPSCWYQEDSIRTACLLLRAAHQIVQHFKPCSAAARAPAGSKKTGVRTTCFHRAVFSYNITRAWQGLQLVAELKLWPSMYGQMHDLRTCETSIVVCCDLVLDVIVASVGVRVVCAGSADKCAIQRLWVGILAVESVPCAL